MYQPKILFEHPLLHVAYITSYPKKADSLYQNSAQYFYQIFIQPALAKVKNSSAKQLIVVPDKNLGHLPFEVFLTEQPDKEMDYANYSYLLKEYSISYSYSATLLVLNEAQQLNRTIPKRGVLAFAAEYENTIDNDKLTSRRGSDIAVIRKVLQPLPGAKKEVNMMRKYLYGQFFDGYPANEATFKEHASDYGIIHLAMHGVLDGNHPILSSLVFSEDSTTQEDNFLRAYEIAQLNLNADLVVLSACETGYGKFRQGEGIMSLAHSFTYAGASSVLMSLWQVNDYATGQIMKNFYMQIAKGLTKNEALRQAKLQFIKESKSNTVRHPAFWAAFVQMGDIEPLELVCKTGLTSSEKKWLTGGSLVFLALLFAWLRSRRRKIAA
ncbi:MAG: CHAT domain-containing protein [Aureispira sp.]|nr:CHAT domain-containing protein [Aureispira sp.]